jgi:hypothetical protein
VKAVPLHVVEEIRRHNIVLHEDEETITAVAPCPTAAHRPERVAPAYIVEFACPHGMSSNAFCGPCTADRRTGRFACLGDWTATGAGEDCPGTFAVAARTFTPTTRRKGRS